MKELSEDQKVLLRKPLPDEAVTQHPTKTYLSSIKAIYVIERLNEVFGIGKWKNPSTIISVNETSGMVVMHVTLIIDEYGIQLESYGGNDNGGQGSKNFDLGDAYKGAMTDAMTKIASFLEIGMDVFKGKQKGKQSETKQPETKAEDTRPWITDKQADQAVQKIKDGESGIYEKCDKEFKMSKANREKIKNAKK